MGRGIGPAPISHPPEHWDGWTAGRAPTHRIIATIYWADGTVTEHRLLTHEWTSDRVRVWVETEHDLPRRVADVWLPLDQVRRNTEPPELGELIPAPEYGRTACRHASQEDIDNWPRETPPTSK